MIRFVPPQSSAAPMARRSWLLGAAAWLITPQGADAADPVADRAPAAEFLAQAERALRDERPAAAAGLFERASRLDDVSAAAELGMMRAYLQAGDYAHAVAWGRLVAGEHPDAPEAAAWADAVEALARPAAAASARPGVPPLPGPAPAALPRAGRPLELLGGGLIAGAPERLLLPPALASALADVEGLRVTDGTGTRWRVRDASGALSRESSGEAEPAPVIALPAVRGARARPGRPVLVLHPGLPARDGAFSWPHLRPALLTFPAAGEHRLGIASPGPAAPRGSPVFDACGQWLGWLDDGRLEPAAAGDEGDACAAGPAGDVDAIYGRWYPAAAVLWRMG
jgi:hypothetical protein